MMKINKEQAELEEIREVLLGRFTEVREKVKESLQLIVDTLHEQNSDDYPIPHFLVAKTERELEEQAVKLLIHENLIDKDDDERLTIHWDGEGFYIIDQWNHVCPLIPQFKHEMRTPVEVFINGGYENVEWEEDKDYDPTSNRISKRMAMDIALNDPDCVYFHNGKISYTSKNTFDNSIPEPIYNGTAEIILDGGYLGEHEGFRFTYEQDADTILERVNDWLEDNEEYHLDQYKS